MSTRDELHRLIDELPEAHLRQAQLMIGHLVNPPETRPEIEQDRQEFRKFRQRVEQQFRATQKPGMGGGMGGAGFVGRAPHGGAFSNKSFHYWDGRAIVFQSLRGYSEQIIESMERLSILEDDSALIYDAELNSGGYTVRHDDEFPRVKSVAG